MAIPKTIHYCWFGRNPKPKLAEKCIKSWKKKCPDYQIIEWNEDNFDISNSPLYVRQAYDAKKWAFVSDYVRLWAMTEYGGIYMDTDVQVLRPLDPFLAHQAFSGFEDDTHISTCIMACEKGFPLFQEFLSYYDDAEFIRSDGSLNYQTNVVTLTNECVRRGLQQNNTFQIIDGFALYPKDYFCPISYETERLKKTRNTATIHWFAASWHSEEERKKHNAEIKKYLQAERKQRFDKFIHTPNRILMALVGKEKYQQFKKKMRG